MALSGTINSMTVSRSVYNVTRTCCRELLQVGKKSWLGIKIRMCSIHMSWEVISREGR